MYVIITQQCLMFTHIHNLKQNECRLSENMTKIKSKLDTLVLLKHRHFCSIKMSLDKRELLQLIFHLSKNQPKNKYISILLYI